MLFVVFVEPFLHATRLLRVAAAPPPAHCLCCHSCLHCLCGAATALFAFGAHCDCVAPHATHTNTHTPQSTMSTCCHAAMLPCAGRWWLGQARAKQRLTDYTLCAFCLRLSFVSHLVGFTHFEHSVEHRWRQQHTSPSSTTTAEERISRM